MRDERKFKEVIHTIKGAEKDKDKFFSCISSIEIRTIAIVKKSDICNVLHVVD